MRWLTCYTGVGSGGGFILLTGEVGTGYKQRLIAHF